MVTVKIIKKKQYKNQTQHNIKYDIFNRSFKPNIKIWEIKKRRNFY